MCILETDLLFICLSFKKQNTSFHKFATLEGGAYGQSRLSIVVKKKKKLLKKLCRCETAMERYSFSVDSTQTPTTPLHQIVRSEGQVQTVYATPFRPLSLTT